MFSVLATLLATTTLVSGINWNGNWATSCGFIGNDLKNSLSSVEDCGGRCASNPGCTHYTWTNYNGGTCWMKKNSVSKSNAVPKYDQGAVCGVIVASVDRAISDAAVTGAADGFLTDGVVGEVIVDSVGGVLTSNISEVIASTINWSGKNWAASCEFVGNDLTNTLSKAEDCGGCCASTPGCTHYTWTDYNGGTCWMKKNLVSKNNAVPKYDQSSMCGVVVGGVFAGNVSEVITSTINWNGKNWAASCEFVGNDLSNALTKSKDCGGCCASTPGCTHYTWTDYNGGTCWMKNNSVSKNNAVPKHNEGAVCGVIIEGVVSSNVSGVIASTINWNGKNWATSCHFIGNDLANILTLTSKDCNGLCSSTPGCTHYTWTNYNGGTCWMKKSSITKKNAVPRHDRGAVCGIVVERVVSGNVSGVIASTINWNGKNWATSCHFIGNDLANVLTASKDCDDICSSTPSCTHYTWTNYNGGTCWMKKNSVSKNNAVPRHDRGAVCGIIVGNSGGVIAGGVSSYRINWNGKNWAKSCDFVGNDLTNALTRAKDCGGRCASTPDCTHYTWTNYNGGTCWMKKNLVSKSNASPKFDQDAVCGVTVGNAGEVATGSASEVSATAINWNGINWVASCDLFGNDITHVLTSAEDCGARCISTPSCTHYTWSNYNGGTCWMKMNAINTAQRYDQGLLFTDHFRRPMPYYKQIIINVA